ncbi:hypothetical protein L0F63_005388, partial [Massospora cicadina]
TELATLIAMSQLTDFLGSLSAKYPAISTSHEVTILVSSLNRGAQIKEIESILESVVGWIKETKASLAFNLVLGGAEPSPKELQSLLGKPLSSDLPLWKIEEYFLAFVSSHFPESQGQVGVACRVEPILRLAPVARDVWFISAIPNELGFTLSEVFDLDKAAQQVIAALNAVLGPDKSGYVYGLGRASKKIGQQLCFNKKHGIEQDEHTVLLMDRIYDVATPSLPPTHLLDLVEQDAVHMCMSYHGDWWEMLLDASSLEACQTTLSLITDSSAHNLTELVANHEAGSGHDAYELVSALATAHSRLRASADPSRLIDTESAGYRERSLGRFRRLLANGADLCDVAAFLVLSYALGGRLMGGSENTEVTDIELLVESDLITVSGSNEQNAGRVMGHLRCLAAARAEITSEALQFCQAASGPFNDLPSFAPLALSLLELVSARAWSTHHSDLTCLSRPLRDKKPARVMGRIFKQLLPTSPGELISIPTGDESPVKAKPIILVYVGGVSFSEISAVRRWSADNHIR